MASLTSVKHNESRIVAERSGTSPISTSPIADANPLETYYGNMLQAASSRGNQRAVKALISEGAHVNTEGGHFATALQAGSFRGREETAAVLIRHGADVNAQGGPYGSALQAACLRGNLSVATLLLRNIRDRRAEQRSVVTGLSTPPRVYSTKINETHQQRRSP